MSTLIVAETGTKTVSAVHSQCRNWVKCDHRTAAKCYSMIGNSTHIHGIHMPVEEPSTESEADIKEFGSDQKKTPGYCPGLRDQ